MRDFIKRSGLAGVVLCLFLTGCGEELWTMTPEEESLIVAYASSAVAKNNKYMAQGLTYYEEPGPEEESVEEPPDTYLEEGQPPEDNLSQDQGQPGEENQNQAGVTSTLSDAVGLGPVTAEYHGYQVMDSYMEGSYFALAAQPGNQLVVMSIGLSNPTQQPVECNNIARSIRCTLKANGEARFQAMSTALLNDFSSYLNTLEPGETQETILFFEVPTEVAGNMQSLGLEFEVDGTVYQVDLQQ